MIDFCGKLQSRKGNHKLLPSSYGKGGNEASYSDISECYDM